MTQIVFSLELAQQLYSSSEKFPIDFDDAWEWLEFSSKGNAKRSFLKAGFVEGVDFCSFIWNKKRSTGATQIEVIKMTRDCFMRWERLSVNKRRKNTESIYRDRLASELNGKKEVPTEAGNIDVLTHEEIIEVKESKAWKSGIGQLMVYGDYYPSHRKRLHLFGDCHETFLKIVQKHCNKRKIKLTWTP